MGTQRTIYAVHAYGYDNDDHYDTAINYFDDREGAEAFKLTEHDHGEGVELTIEEWPLQRGWTPQDRIWHVTIWNNGNLLHCSQFSYIRYGSNVGKGSVRTVMSDPIVGILRDVAVAGTYNLDAPAYQMGNRELPLWEGYFRGSNVYDAVTAARQELDKTNKMEATKNEEAIYETMAQ